MSDIMEKTEAPVDPNFVPAQAKGLRQDIIDQLSDAITNTTDFMTICSDHVFRDMRALGIVDPHELINCDGPRYSEEAEEIYYNMQASYIRRYVMEAIRNF